MRTLPDFLARYGAATENLRAAIEAFPPETLRAWSAELGQSTYVGSSGRVFPVAMKASPLLRAWLRRLDARGVKLALRHDWTGWDDAKRLTFNAPDGPATAEADAAVLALGGASWPRLGSDGGWAGVLTRTGIGVSPLKPANCGFLVAWSEHLKRFAGQPLKRIALSFGEHTTRGEAIVTETGLEGGAIYALAPALRDAIEQRGEATLHIALRPDLWVKEIERKSAIPRGKQSLSNFLRKMFSLSPVEIALLQESTGGKLAALAPAEVAALINAVPIRLTGVAPIARAISTAGGIAFGELDAQLHAAPYARRVRGGRDARLGSADRRLSAASLFRDRRRRRTRCIGMARDKLRSFPRKRESSAQISILNCCSGSPLSRGRADTELTSPSPASADSARSWASAYRGNWSSSW